jgi:protein SCO1/2
MRKYLVLAISIILLLLAGFAIWSFQPVPSVKIGEAGIGKVEDRRIVKSQGEAAIGGEFNLIDANENKIDEKILQGHFSLVYFGFTSCPAVCPTTLGNITNALDRIGDLSDEVQPIFISVDPKRDTPAVMREYISNFHPSFLALTGTEEQSKQAASAFKVYFQAENPDAKDYNVNHSDFIYLMDRTGKYVTHFTQEDSAEKMAQELLRYVR